MDDSDLTTNQKGAIAETAIAHEAIKLGLDVYTPVAEGGRYDLILGLGPRLLRVQCKWARLVDGVVAVRLRTSRHSARGYVRTKYSPTEIDAAAAYCPDLEECYLLPISLVAGKNMISLRVSPTRNGQTRGLNWARQYRLGAIAQLGERRHGMAEAAGSSPASST
jgi:hypothetical protein